MCLSLNEVESSQYEYGHRGTQERYGQNTAFASSFRLLVPDFEH